MDDIHARYDPLLGRGARRRPRAADGLLDLPLGLVQRRPDAAGHLDRRLHARPDAAAVARRRPTIRVAQPEPYFDPRLPDRAAMARRVRRRRPRTVLRRQPASGSARRPTTTARRSSTATGTSTRRWRRCSPTPGWSCSWSRPRSRRGSATSRAWWSPRASRSRSSRSGRPACCWSRTSTSRRPGSRPARPPTSRPTSRSTRTARRSRARRSGSTTRSRSRGYTFHQNGFGPAPHLVVRDAAGKPLWDGAVPLTDAADGLAVRDPVGPGPRPRPAAAARRKADDGRRSS